MLRGNRNIKPILAMLLASLMMLSSSAFAETAVFSDGSGTTEDPWQIATAEELDLMHEHLDGHFILTTDIDLSGYENWTPIGSFRPKSDAPEDAEVPHPDYVFSGTFDGAGHTISNLTVNEPSGMAVGLFGCVAGGEDAPASISNVTLENVFVTGYYLVGGAVGLQFMNAPVENVRLVGDNHLSGLQGIGGIVGTGFDTVSNCSAVANITVLGDDGACAGIVAGGMTFGALLNCTAESSNIVADGDVCWGFGGLCGAPWATTEISGCSVKDVSIAISGENGRLIGGMLGFAGSYEGMPTAQIVDCKVDGISITVSDTTNSVGGLVGGGKEYTDGSNAMSSFSIEGCSVSGRIIGGGAFVDAVVGDLTCAVSIECDGGATIE